MIHGLSVVLITYLLHIGKEMSYSPQSSTEYHRVYKVSQNTQSFTEYTKEGKLESTSVYFKPERL